MKSFEHPPYHKDRCYSQYQSNFLFLVVIELHRPSVERGLSDDLICIRFGPYHLNIMFELDVRFDIYIGLDIEPSLVELSNIRFLFLLDINLRLSTFFGLNIWFILKLHLFTIVTEPSILRAQ